MLVASWQLDAGAKIVKILFHTKYFINFALYTLFIYRLFWGILTNSKE
jgi:hypothetical protein